MKVRRFLPLFVLPFALACKSGNDHDTAIVVYVQSDLSIPTGIDRVKIKTTAAANRAPLHEYTFMLGQGDRRVVLPVREGLYPTSGSQAAIRVEAQGLLGDILVVSRAAVLSFVPGKKVVLDLSLLASCKTTSCPSGLTCGPGGCQVETVDGSLLPIYQPGLAPSGVPTVDAAVADAYADSSTEAGVEDGTDDRVAASSEVGADAALDSAVDVPVSTGGTTGTTSRTETGTTQTGTFTADTGSGSTVLTGTGTGPTATGTGIATPTTGSTVLTGTGTATAATTATTPPGTSSTATGTKSTPIGTGTVASNTQTSTGTAATSTSTGTTLTTGTGTATKIGTMTTVGTTILTGTVGSTSIVTATVNVTVPSTGTAIVTQTVSGSATATLTASESHTVTLSYTSSSTNTSTSTAGEMAMTYLLLTKDDSLPAATDTSTSTQTVQNKIALDQSGKAFCGTSIVPYACSAYLDYVAAGEANLFAPSSTRFQPSTNSNSRIYDCSWTPTPTGKISISVWVKPSQVTGSKQSILAWNFGDVQLYLDGNGRAACLPVGNTPSNTISLPLNQWSHLVCTQNSTTWTLYMNGSSTRATNTAPSTFRNPQHSSTNLCLGFWYLSGWDLTDITNPCTASSQTPVRFAGDLSLLRVYHDYTLSALEVDNLHLCNNPSCTGTVLLTGTATATGTQNATGTVSITATATAIGTVPTTTTATATGTVIITTSAVGTYTATVVQTGTQVQNAHRL